MDIRVNGHNRSFDKPAISVKEMLVLCEVNQPDMVSVQLNGKFVNKENYGSTELKHGDEVDFLYFMGGGQEAS